jgi:uncharacterized membrane protein
MKRSHSIGSLLRRWFFSGLLVVVPLVVTYIVLRMFFKAVDGILAPVVATLYGKPIPGLGLLVTFLLVMLAGAIAAGVGGGRLIRLWEGWLSRIPLIRVIYGGAKQMLESISRSGGSSFQQVGLVEYPRAGLYSICFLANRLPIHTNGREDLRVTAFIPSTPTPFTGSLILVKPEEIIPIDLSVEDAIKLIVSGGILVPPLAVNAGKAG